MFIVAALLGFAAGFGVGRIKNVSKLAAISAHLEAIEAVASQEVKNVIADVRHLITEVRSKL